jgi:hypothetical protein
METRRYVNKLFGDGPTDLRMRVPPPLSGFLFKCAFNRDPTLTGNPIVITTGRNARQLETQPQRFNAQHKF